MHRAGAAYIFERDDQGHWSEVAKLLPSEPAADDEAESAHLGSAVSLSGWRALIGADTDEDLGTAAGAAYAFSLGAALAR